MNTVHNVEVETAEAALKQAMMTSDVPTLEQLLSDDLLFTNHLGQRMTKQDDLAAHRSGKMAINHLELFDQDIKMLGTVAIVNVAAHIGGTFAGTPFEETLRFTRVWQAMAPGTWQIIAAQATAVANPE